MNSEERMEELVRAIRQSPALIGELMGPDDAIVRAALAGKNVHEIAQEQRIPEEAVWEVLGNAARAATGQPLNPVETGGLGGADE